MRNSDDLNVVVEHAIHDEKGKAEQQYAPGVSEVRRTGIGLLGNQIARSSSR
jgi:hypothetical protein